MTFSLQQLAERNSGRLILVAELGGNTGLTEALGVAPQLASEANDAQPRTYRFLGTSRENVNCDSSIIFTAALKTFPTGIQCHGEDVLGAYIPSHIHIPYAELTWGGSLVGDDAPLQDEESGYYVYVRQYETQEYWCGPYFSYRVAKEAQRRFLRNPNVNAASSPTYFSDRPREHRYCNPNSFELTTSTHSSGCNCGSTTHAERGEYFHDLENVETIDPDNLPSVLGRILVTIQVNCPKCGCYLASFNEYRESSSSIYVGAIVTISYRGACYQKDRCLSGRFDWRGTVTRGKIIRIRD